MTFPVIPVVTPPPLPIALDLLFTDPNSEFDFEYTESFFLSGQFQKSLTVVNTAGFVPVDITNINTTFEKIIVIDRDTFYPPLLKTVRFTIDGSPLSNYNIDLPFQKIFMWNLPASYVSKVLNMYVSTASITPVRIDVILLSTTIPAVVP